MTTARQSAPGIAARRAEICRTAAQMIRERGFDATSVNDIARALGLTKAGLYHYISGKDALLVEILTFGMDQIDAEVVVPVRAIADPVERLRQLVTRHASIVTRGQGAVTHLGGEVKSLPSTARRKVERRMRLYFDLVRDTLAGVKAEGRLRDVDLTVAAFSILGMILWLPRWFRPDGALTAEQVSEEIARLALGGVLLEPTPRRARRLRLLKSGSTVDR
jgi:AcrR family transcriptional regulator